MMMMMKKVLIGIATAMLIGGFSASAEAGGIKEIHGLETGWKHIVVSRAMTNLNRGRRWTPTDFAIARGDINSVSKTRITKNVIIKSGMASTLLLSILPWIKD
tara:strand:+ start:191 stop:499 length:309 start_codon:yes stop_codon:yes gene_type:complete